MLLQVTDIILLLYCYYTIVYDKRDKNEARKVEKQEGCKRLKGQLRENEEQSQMLYEDQEMYHKQKSVNQVQLGLSEWKIKELRMWNEMGENQIDYQQSKNIIYVSFKKF